MGFDADALIKYALVAIFPIIVAGVLFAVLKGIEALKKTKRGTRATAAQQMSCLQQPLDIPPPPFPQSNRRNSKWDVVGILTNVIMAILYAPFSFFCLFGVFMADYPPESIVAEGLLYATIYLLLTVPMFCIVGIIWSVIARSRGKYKFSFAIQFLPLGLCAVGMFLLFLSGIFA